MSALELPQPCQHEQMEVNSAVLRVMNQDGKLQHAILRTRIRCAMCQCPMKFRNLPASTLETKTIEDPVDHIVAHKPVTTADGQELLAPLQEAERPPLIHVA